MNACAISPLSYDEKNPKYHLLMAGGEFYIIKGVSAIEAA